MDQLFLLFHYVVSNIDVEPLLFHIEIVKPPHNAFVSSGWFSPFIVVDHLAFLDETTLSDYRFCYEIIIGEEANRALLLVAARARTDERAHVRFAQRRPQRHVFSPPPSICLSVSLSL